jgi:drug/metabolite transporter (DMT)-like permease
MTPFALSLVLVAALLHATWNLCAKRAGGGLPWVCLVGMIICSLYVPVVAFYWLHYRPALTREGVLWVIGSGLLKTGYSLFLQKSYRSGDFSLIYPMARGTGPLLSTLGAIVLFGERPSLLALCGALMIVGAIFAFTGGSRLLHQDSAHLRRAAGYGIGTGLFIAAYTLWDKHGVSSLAVPPLLYDAGTAITMLILVSPFGYRRREEVARHWRLHKRYAFGMALLSPVAYVLVLTAIRISPVSAVAPAREISIVIGAFFGARLLDEADGRRRILAATVMAAGVIALVVG